MIRILHFADAHIDIANHGRRDPESGLAVRVLDFLHSLDEIVEAAVQNKVDCVVFAGDAYKDRNPSPTYQREWGSRIMRLSRAEIPTLLLVGNHDISPAVGRAHALAEFSTLNVPHVKILDKPGFFSADDLEDISSENNNLNLQVIALPWMSRSEISAHLDLPTRDPNVLYQEYFQHLKTKLDSWLNQADPEKPTLLTAHASVEGAVYGGERSVSLGSDPVLPLELLTDPRIDYVALGHIHKPQDLNKDQQPPVIYPGSIERVDFGEAKDEKFYILADLEPGQTNIEWKPLQNIRKFLDLDLELKSRDKINEQIMDAMPDQRDLEDAIVRLVLEYPRSWESLINEQALLEYAEPAFEFHLVKQPLMEDRLRLPRNQVLGSLSPEDLLNHYWELTKTPEEEREELNQLASELFDTDTKS